MKYDVGSMVFDRIGRPGVVVKRNSDGSAVAEKSGERFEQAKLNGFINGLNPTDRKDFNQVSAEVRQRKIPEEKVAFLQEKVEQLRQDPTRWVLKRYLESEMAFIMKSEGNHPPDFVFTDKDI